MPTIKIVTILENNPITGVVYGTKDFHLQPVGYAQAVHQYQKAATRKALLVKKRAENMKHK